MANLSILSGIEFYSYDVEVYDKVLLGIIRYKDSQIAKFKKIDSTFFENKSFYGINRGELVKEFIKYLSKFDSKIDKDSFLLGDVVDKRIKKGEPYVNDTMIFMASPKQYDAQASNKSATPKVESPKEVLKLPMEYKDKIYKVRLNLEELDIGTGQKMLYDFNETMLKSKVESFLKSYKKEYDVQLSLQEEFVQVGKLLIDVTVYNDHVEGFIDLSSLNLDGITSIQAEGKDKQELLNNIIQQLKSHKLTGKLNWGKVVDKTKKEGEKKMANETTTATLKKLVKNLATMVKKVGFDEQEIDGRIMSIIPNAKPEGVGVGGNKVDLSYTLPWVLDKNQVKKKKFAEEVAETAQSNVVIKEVGLTLYILDEVEGEINISISADVRWINTFFGTTELDSYTLIEQVVPIQEATPVEVNNSGGEIMAGNLLLQEFIEKIASRPNVKLIVKIDKYTPFPVSFDVDENGFEQVSVRFENNATKFRANFRLSGPFSELQSKTYSFCHYLDTIGFDVTQEGLGAVVKGEYDNGDISIVNDLVTLLDKIKAFSYNHANSFEAWAKKHKYGYTEAKVFFQVRDIIPNYDGDAIVYKSGKSNYIAIPNDVEGIDGFIDAVKHAYTPDKAGAFYRFYFPNLEEMQKFVEFANNIEKPSKVEVEKEVKPEPSLKNAYVKKGNTPPKSNGKPIKEPKNLVYVAFKNRIANLPEVHLNAELDDNDPHIVGFQVSIKGYQQFDVGFYENYSRFNVRIMVEGSIMELEKPTKDLCQAFVNMGFDAKLDGFAVSINYKFHPENNMFVTKLEQIMNIAKQFAKVKFNKPQPSAQDLGGVAPNNEPIREPVNTQEPKGIVVEKGERAIDKINFAKGQKYEVTEVTLGLKGEPDYNTYEIEVLSIFANGKVRCKNLTLGYEFKIGLEPTNKRKIYRILQDVPEMKKEIDKLKDKIIKDEVNKVLGKDKEVPVEVPVQNEVEPPNREVERTYKAGKVKDPEHKAQLDRMKAYIKKIADVVDADNDFALRFLEEPKEFQKYKLPTVGVGLFYYGDKSATELEQNALYKKVYRGRGLSILRKFFKTTDLNGEKCLLVLFVDAQYAKETKAKLIKESFELGNKVRINGRLYKVNAIYEHKFAIETIAGLMYIDMDSDLIDITIEED